jgi:hypothetical protein
MTDKILTQSAIEKSFDNLSIVIISFKNLENFFKQHTQTALPKIAASVPKTPEPDESATPIKQGAKEANTPQSRGQNS